MAGFVGKNPLAKGRAERQRKLRKMRAADSQVLRKAATKQRQKQASDRKAFEKRHAQARRVLTKIMGFFSRKKKKGKGVKVRGVKERIHF